MAHPDAEAIKAKLQPLLISGGFDLPNIEYDEDDSICLEDNDLEFRIVIQEL